MKLAVIRRLTVSLNDGLYVFVVDALIQVGAYALSRSNVQASSRRSFSFALGTDQMVPSTEPHTLPVPRLERVRSERGSSRHWPSDKLPQITSWYSK